MISIKAILGDEHRRCSVAAIPDFASLCEALATLFCRDCKSFHVFYRDDENDLVRISSNMDLQEALRLTASTFNIVLVPQATPTDDQPAGSTLKPEKAAKTPKESTVMAKKAPINADKTEAKPTSIQLRCAASGKFLRILPNGSVDGSGGNGPWAHFALIQENGSVRLQNVGNQSHFLQILPNGTVNGKGHGTGDSSLFELVNGDNDTVALAQKGNYIRVDADSVATGGVHPGSWMTITPGVWKPKPAVRRAAAAPAAATSDASDSDGVETLLRNYAPEQVAAAAVAGRGEVTKAKARLELVEKRLVAAEAVVAKLRAAQRDAKLALREARRQAKNSVATAAVVEADKKVDSASHLAARFVCDVSVPDGTVVQPSNHFTKIWRLRNCGDEAWPAGCKLFQVRKNKDSVDMAITSGLVPPVAPGAETDVMLDMMAPATPGRYLAHYRLAVPTGPKFGQRIWVDITVADPGALVATPDALTTPTDMPTAQLQRAPEDLALGAALVGSAPVMTTEVLMSPQPTAPTTLGPVVADNVTDPVVPVCLPASFKPVCAPASYKDIRWAEELSALTSMGFCEYSLNQRLLRRYKGSVPDVVEALLRGDAELR